MFKNIVNEVTQAKDNLHGDQKLATDKTNAKDTLDHLTHLNHAQNKNLRKKFVMQLRDLVFKV